MSTIFRENCLLSCHVVVCRAFYVRRGVCVLWSGVNIKACRRRVLQETQTTDDQGHFIDGFDRRTNFQVPTIWVFLFVKLRILSCSRKLRYGVNYLPEDSFYDSSMIHCSCLRPLVVS